MSIGAGLGAEGNLLEESPSHAHQLVLDQPILRNHELETLRTVSHDIFKPHTIDITWPVADGRRRDGGRADARSARRPTTRSRAASTSSSCPTARRPRARADPVAARGRRRAPPPRARGHAPADGPRDRDRRGAPGPPHRDADRLRRERREPVGDVRDRRRGGRRRPAASTPAARALEPRRGRARRPQGDRQGPAEDDLEDGDLDDPVLLRRADLRGGRALARARRPPLHRHRVAHRRRRPRRARAGGARRATAAPIRTRRATCCRSAASTRGGATASTTCGTRTRSRCSSTPCAAAARRPTRSSRASPTSDATRRATLRGLLEDPRDQTPVPLEEVEPWTEIVKRFVTGAMSLGSLVARGAREPRDRDEPHRRQVEHRRGRRGPGALPRRAPLGDQAGRLGPLRRDDRVPRQRRRAADQDGAGREAGRGRPAAGRARSTSTSGGSATRRPASA